VRGAGYICLPHPPDSDTVQHQPHHRCSSQSRAFKYQCKMADVADVRTIRTGMKKSKQRIRSVRPNKKINQVVLHDNARPHTGLCTRKAIATMEWTVLPRHPYSLELAPLLTYLLTPWSIVLHEKLTGSAASQEIPRIFGPRRFITVLTVLSWANSIQSPQAPPTS